MEERMAGEKLEGRAGSCRLQGEVRAIEIHV